MTRGMGGGSPANIAHHLKGIDFPAEKEDLLRHAKKNGGGREVTEAIAHMPERRYESMADVMKGLGEVE